MWIGGVQIPESLMTALEEDRLVVFAGAGVSAGTPSNIPPFDRLTEKIIEQTGNLLPWDHKEPADRFLGRLGDRGPNVHIAVEHIIKSADGGPARIHKALVQVFRRVQDLRIVTTNYDTHLEVSAKDVFSQGVPVYRAPALPIGSRFSGIVYLHGCVEDEPDRMVVTDRDFGTAYLTEGWATRFLIGVFRNYEVLFVGYSHGDITMEYLGRGLPPGTRRYALVPEDEIDNWKYRGIELLSYVHQQDDREHIALTEFVDSWASYRALGYTDHEQRLRSILDSLPSIDEEQRSYVEQCIKEPVKVRLFCRNAKGVQWLRWVEERGLLKPLFGGPDPMDESSRVLAGWLGEACVGDYPEEVLAVIQRQGQRLCPVLWQSVATGIWRARSRLPPQTLSGLLNTLMSPHNPLPVPIGALDYVLEEWDDPEQATTALNLLEFLAHPYLVLEPGYVSSNDQTETRKVAYKVAVLGDEHSLHEAWTKFFRKQLSNLADQIEPVITNHLLLAYQLLASVGSVHADWDPISFKRRGIEANEFDDMPHELDFLIDAGRDIVEALLLDRPDVGRALVERWSLSVPPLLRRLAVHGTAVNLVDSPDARITWILDKGWLFSSGVKHEVFQLLKTSYSKSTTAVRQRLEDSIRLELESASDTDKEEARDTRVYEVYNLLVWLVRVDPGCARVKRLLAEVQAQYTHFGPRDHPDVEWTMETKWAGSESPFTADELLTKPYAETIPLLLTFQGEGFRGPDRAGLLNELKAAAKKSVLWSLGLVKELCQTSDSKSDIWHSIVSAWRECALGESNWQQVLQVLVDDKEVRREALDVAWLIEEGAGRKEGGMTPPLIETADALADLLWLENRDTSTGEHALPGSWLTTAINHVGGVLTEFWLQRLSHIRTESPAEWVGLPEKDRLRLGRIVAEGSPGAVWGRVILASQLSFLFAVDREWTLAEVVPLLDWSKDAERASQAWSGYLSGGGLHEGLIPSLLTLYEQTWERLPQQAEEFKHLGDHVAAIAIRNVKDVTHSGWLDRFLSNVSEEDRVLWAEQVAHQLASLPEEAKIKAWMEWIKAYWSRRIQGLPLEITRREAGAMVSWCFPLKSVFPGIVELIRQGPSPDTGKSAHFYHMFGREDFPERYPAETASLLFSLLSGTSPPFYRIREAEKILGRVFCVIPPNLKSAIQDELARLR